MARSTHPLLVMTSICHRTLSSHNVNLKKGHTKLSFIHYHKHTSSLGFVNSTPAYCFRYRGQTRMKLSGKPLRDRDTRHSRHHTCWLNRHWHSVKVNSLEHTSQILHKSTLSHAKFPFTNHFCGIHYKIHKNVINTLEITKGYQHSGIHTIVTYTLPR